MDHEEIVVCAMLLLSESSTAVTNSTVSPKIMHILYICVSHFSFSPYCMYV